ncbi:DNA gyrase inhibitor YacG [Methylophilus sp. 5]|uniref:DNA gyrase inhibitor YacG n=1 Tax=Methylophilus sp. 5 TaxID=1112274 RepID=UPI000491270C|nr:DNA gyrase inhibitor YacG [Methylophilus sp. 5]
MTQPAVKARKVACPACGETSEYSTANPYRPFCSERCKLVDLGDWATEKFRIPDNTPPDMFEPE